MFKTDSFGIPLPTEASKFISEIRLAELGHEYSSSIYALEKRLNELKSKVKTVPPKQKPDIEQRISILHREILEARKTGADAAGYYTSSDLPLPKNFGGETSC